MEIILTLFNNLTETQTMYMGSAATALGVLTLILLYVKVIGPKRRRAAVLKRVRAQAYKKAQRKVKNDNDFTWGENIDRTNIGAAYVVEEMDAEMNTRLKKVLRDVN